MGIFFMTGNSAGFVSSNVYPNRTAPRYLLGHSVAIGFAGMAIACAIILMFDNGRRNRERDAKYGRVVARSKETVDSQTGRAVDPYDRERWGLDPMMSDVDVANLGDLHPCEWLVRVEQLVDD